MFVRRILGIMLCCGALATLEGPSARAQAHPSNPALFVQILLARESNQIMKQSQNIARQDREIRLLNLLETEPQTARIERAIRQLTRAIDQLQFAIVNRNTQLVGLNIQVNGALAGLTTPNPYTSLAATNAAIIKTFTARPPFGILPVTASQ